MPVRAPRHTLRRHMHDGRGANRKEADVRLLPELPAASRVTPGERVMGGANPMPLWLLLLRLIGYRALWVIVPFLVIVIWGWVRSIL